MRAPANALERSKALQSQSDQEQHGWPGSWPRPLHSQSVGSSGWPRAASSAGPGCDGSSFAVALDAARAAPRRLALARAGTAAAAAPACRRRQRRRRRHHFRLALAAARLALATARLALAAARLALPAQPPLPAEYRNSGTFFGFITY
jgi:hypothetical protein